MSRACRSVKEAPSVTTNCMVSTLVLSTVGLYTSDSTPPATVNHIFDVLLLAVPTQSLRARSKCDRAPEPSAAPTPACAGDAEPSVAAAATTTITFKRKAVRDRADQPRSIVARLGVDTTHLPTCNW